MTYNDIYNILIDNDFRKKKDYVFYNGAKDLFASVGTVPAIGWACHIWKRKEEGDNCYNEDQIIKKIKSYV